MEERNRDGKKNNEKLDRETKRQRKVTIQSAAIIQKSENLQSGTSVLFMPDMVMEVMSFLEQGEIIIISLTCRSWRQVGRQCLKKRRANMTLEGMMEVIPLPTGRKKLWEWWIDEIRTVQWVDMLAAAERGHLAFLESFHQKFDRNWKGLIIRAVGYNQVAVIKWVKTLFPGKKYKGVVEKEAAERGHIEVLQSILDEAPKAFNTEDIAYTSSQNGHQKVIQWMIEKGLFKEKTKMWACYGAAAGGHFKLLCELVADGLPTSLRYREQLCRHAVEGGRMDILGWLLKNGCTLNETMYIDFPPRNDSMCLLYSLEYITENTGLKLAERGHVDMLAYLEVTGKLKNVKKEKLLYAATQAGQKEVMEWCHQQLQIGASLHI